MSIGNNHVFPFPAVQYIPLPVTTLQEGTQIKKTTRRPIPGLLVGQSLFEWRSLIQSELGIELPGDFNGPNLPILALNVKVTEVKYRGYEVVLVGRSQAEAFHLFTIPNKYFYKSKLYYKLYDADNGKLLANYSTFLSGAKLQA